MSSDPGSLLPTQWIELFKGADVAVMVGIGIIAFVLEYSRVVPKGWIILIPLTLGAVWGVAEAMQAGYGTAAHVFKGAIYNGGAASVFGRGVTFALRKYWKATSSDSTGELPKLP